MIEKLGINLDEIGNIFSIIAAVSALSGLFSITNDYRKKRKDLREITEDFQVIVKASATKSSVDHERSPAAEATGRHDVPSRISEEDKKYALFLQYHAQGLSQSNVSFWFSLIFASIGFLIIVSAVLTVQKNTSIGNQSGSFISLVSGTVIDCVAALFFVQSNKARQLMIDFFDKLRTDRKFEESLSLANNIPDKLLKSKLQILLSMNFADVKVSDDILTSILKDKSITNVINE